MMLDERILPVFPQPKEHEAYASLLAFLDNRASVAEQSPLVGPSLGRSHALYFVMGQFLLESKRVRVQLTSRHFHCLVTPCCVGLGSTARFKTLCQARVAFLGRLAVSASSFILMAGLGRDIFAVRRDHSGIKHVAESLVFFPVLCSISSGD